MERHRCKLCSRAFANGRALGGHMKAHLATFPLPPKTHQVTESNSSSSSSSSSGEEPEEEEQHLQEEEEEEKGLTYGLRENPKRSFRLADPEFSFVDAGSVIQDRESETESRNPTRRRSKRNRRSFAVVTDNLQSQKLELKKKPKLTISTPPRLAESPPLAAELEPVSSVSDTSPEEDVAMCLMMLSRDVWMIRLHDHQQADQSAQAQEQSRQVVEELEGVKLKKLRGKNRCEKCNKLFRSFQAMCGHKKICFRNEEEAINNAGGEKLFECPFCYKIFGSGQALGGHKRSHLSGSSRSMVVSVAAKTEVKEGFIDLNLPAPEEDDEFSVLSDA